MSTVGLECIEIMDLDSIDSWFLTQNGAIYDIVLELLTHSEVFLGGKGSI